MDDVEEILKDGIDKLKRIDKNFGFEDFVRGVLEDNEQMLLELNYESQLYSKGIDSKGASLGVYAESTIKKKKRKGQITSHVTLRDEFIFHKTFFVHHSFDQMEIMAYDPVGQYLILQYGEDIHGLTPEHIKLVTEKLIIPAIKQLIGS